MAAPAPRVPPLTRALPSDLRPTCAGRHARSRSSGAGAGSWGRAAEIDPSRWEYSSSEGQSIWAPAERRRPRQRDARDVLATGPLRRRGGARQNASDARGASGSTSTRSRTKPGGWRAPAVDGSARHRISVLYVASQWPELAAGGVIGGDDECVDAPTAGPSPIQFGDAAREAAGQSARDDVPVAR